MKLKPTSPSITVVLNAWGRPDLFLEQKQAVLNQTIKPKEIMVWHNHHKTESFNPSWFEGTTYSGCNYNMGVWSRFMMALNAKTEYICVFDDDTIPGTKWFENCIDTIQTHNGLLGTAGVNFNTSLGYKPFEHVGWRKPNEKIVRVDIVGHAWFFRREWLGLFWEEMPLIELPSIAGEDIHFSYALQKNGINTFCPPHPIGKEEMWGSTKGLVYGRSGPAISKKKKGWRAMNKCYKHYVSKGFKPHTCVQKESLQKSGG